MFEINNLHIRINTISWWRKTIEHNQNYKEEGYAKEINCERLKNLRRELDAILGRKFWKNILLEHFWDLHMSNSQTAWNFLKPEMDGKSTLLPIIAFISFNFKKPEELRAAAVSAEYQTHISRRCCLKEFQLIWLRFLATTTKYLWFLILWEVYVTSTWASQNK